MWAATQALCLTLALPAFPRGQVAPIPTAPPDAPPQRLSVSADRDRLQLGIDGEAQIDIAGPEDMTDLRLSTQAGAVETATRLGPGRFVARYVPPAETFPRIALIAAVARSDGRLVHGWLALPLWGTGVAELRTRPGARVGVDIAGARFGPVRAGRDGVASVDVRVPPGVHQGHDGRKPVDLHVPAAPRALVVALRDDARADRAERVPLLIYAVAEDGTPADRAPTVAAARGDLSPLRPATPGVWNATLLLSSGHAEPVELRAAADPGAPAATAALPVAAGPAHVVSLAVPEGALSAGAAVPLRVSVVDRAGNPAGGSVELSASLGEPSSPIEGGPGTWTARLSVPRGLGGRERVEIRARMHVDGAEIGDVVSRPLSPGPVASLALRAPRRAQADGRTPVEIVVDARDRDGNRVSDAPTASARVGAMGAVEAQGGEYVVRWTPPHADVDTTGEVAVRVAATEERAHFELYPRPHRLTLAAKAGYLRGVGNLSLPALAIELGTSVPARGYPLWLLLEAGFSRASNVAEAQGEPLSGQAVRAETDVTSLALSGAWRPRLGRRFLASASGGAGLLAVDSRVRLGDQPQATDHTIVPAAQGALGIGWRLWRGFALVEGRYRWAADADRPTVQGPLSSAGIFVGYGVELL